MLEILSFIVIFIGCFFCLTSLLGCKRFPDFYTKMHAVGVSDNFGCPTILVGVALQAGTLIMFFKILFLVLLMLVINPTSSYILNKFTYKYRKVK